MQICVTRGTHEKQSRGNYIYVCPLFGCLSCLSINSSVRDFLLLAVLLCSAIKWPVNLPPVF